MLEYNITCINVVRCHKISANYLSIETYLCIFFNSILHCVFVFLFFVFTPPWNCGGAIFLLQFVCVCVCLSVRLRTKWGSNRYQTCLVLRISVTWLRFWVQTTHATHRIKKNMHIWCAKATRIHSTLVKNFDDDVMIFSKN